MVLYNGCIRICCSVIGYPEKLTVYTTLVDLLNAKNYTCGGKVSVKLQFKPTVRNTIKESIVYIPKTHRLHLSFPPSLFIQNLSQT